MGRQVEMLTGKDYPELCESCRSAIDTAYEIIMLGEDDRYSDNPEAPSDYAYDRGWFCLGHLGCKNTSDAYDDEDDDHAIDLVNDAPSWVIAVWKENGRQDQFLPIAFSFEDWPVHGGMFDAIAETLGWRVSMDNLLTVGGMYVPKVRSASNRDIVGLVCLDLHTAEGTFFREVYNPVFVIPNEGIDLAEWGLA